MTRGTCPKCGSVYSTTCGEGSGQFIFSPPESGVFDYLDALCKIFKDPDSATIDRFMEAKKFWAHANICMVCGHIFGDVSEEQKKLWSIKYSHDSYFVMDPSIRLSHLIQMINKVDDEFDRFPEDPYEGAAVMNRLLEMMLELNTIDEHSVEYYSKLLKRLHSE